MAKKVTDGNLEVDFTYSGRRYRGLVPVATLASLLTGSNAQTLPVMVASQTGSQGINWWTMAALSTAAIAPLVFIGIFLERYIVMGLTAGSGK